MQIQSVNNVNANTSFKQLQVTQAGANAIKRLSMEWSPIYGASMNRNIEIANSVYPKTEYWDLIIDSVPKFNKSLEQIMEIPFFKYIYKKTGEVFESLRIIPPANDLYLPKDVLRISNEGCVDTAAVKEIVFNVDGYLRPYAYWSQASTHGNEPEIYTYKLLETLSKKYPFSINRGVI